MLVAEILAVEAYHAGAIRTLLYQQRSTVTPYNVTVADIVEAIATLRQRVGGGVDQGIVGSDSNDEANIVPADPDSLASARTPTQVTLIPCPGYHLGLQSSCVLGMMYNLSYHPNYT